MKMNTLLLAFILSTGFSQADVQSNMAEVLLTAEFQGSEGNKEAALDGLIKKIDTIGYSTVAVNKNIQNHYYNKFAEKNVEMLSFFSMVNKEKLRPLLLSNPDFGAYAPFNFLAYKTLDTEFDNNTWYGHLASDTMLDIIGAKNETNKKAFKAMVSDLDTLVNKELTPALVKRFEHTKPLPRNGLTKFVKTFEATDDIEEFMEEFIMEHDSNFAKRNFIIAGFIDFKFEYDDMELEFEKYDAYWVSLLCHFKFSNAIFNRGVPEGAMFAPCAIYFYIPKGTHELHVGYANVDNWVNALNFRDQRRVDYMKAIDAEVQEAFDELGFTKIEKKEKSSTAIKVISAGEKSELEALKAELAKVKAERDALKVTVPVRENLKKETKKEEVKTKVKVSLPALTQKKFTTSKVKIGAVAGEKLSAYYAAQPQYIDVLKKKLKANGFEVLSQTEVLKGNIVLSITNKQLQATNTYMAVLNLNINGTSEIRVQNPTYLGRAYLQDTYKVGQFTDTLKALEATLGQMYEVNDNYETEELADYQFMMGMPHFDDVMEIAEGKDLRSKINAKKESNEVAYILTLPNGSTLVGHKLKSRTNAFLKKITAERNANLLPYQSLIKDDIVVILDPKYYLALSLPLLTMSDFMKIASAPGEIEKNIETAYK